MTAFDKKSSAILVLAICITANDALACGEVLFHSSGALRYHAFSTHYPATILFYSGRSAAEKMPAKDAKLHDELEKAGHKVTAVRGPDELSHALAQHHYDVLIVYARDMDSVLRQVNEVSSREPVLIPVIDHGAKNERELRERFPRTVSDDAELNDFLKTIEQLMKSRKA